MVKDYDACSLILTIIQLSGGAYNAEEISEIIEMIKLYEEEEGESDKRKVFQLFVNDEQTEH